MSRICGLEGVTRLPPSEEFGVQSGGLAMTTLSFRAD